MTPSRTPNRRLVVLSRAPIAGFVKTRLAAVIGPDEALRVHQLLVTHVLAEVARVLTLSNDTDAVVRVTPDEAAETARTWVPSAIRTAPQGGGDLGERMARALDESFMEGVQQVVVVGTDCPGFTAAHALAAFAGLDETDVVLGPATDGGYWLIGARTPTPTLFRDIPWSTADVLALTRRRAHEAGLSVAELETLSDVDTMDDLIRLRRDHAFLA